MKSKEVFSVTYVERDLDGDVDETSVLLFGSYKDAKRKFDTIVEDIAAFWEEQKKSGIDVEYSEYHSEALREIVSYAERGYGSSNCSWVDLRSNWVYFDEEEGE